MNLGLDAIQAFDEALYRISGSEVSDETYLAQRERFEVVEKHPAPLLMTDSQRLEWFKEYCDRYEYVRPTKTTLGQHVIICDGEMTSAANFNDAVDLAAAKLNEANS